MKYEFIFKEQTFKAESQKSICQAWESLKLPFKKTENLEYCRVIDVHASEIVSANEFQAWYLEFLREKHVAEECVLDACAAVGL